MGEAGAGAVPDPAGARDPAGPRTTTQLTADAAARFRSRPAIWHDGQALTFAALDARAREVGCGLIAAGVQAGDRVAIWAANQPDWFAVDRGVAMAGAAVVPIYATSSIEEALWILGDTSARIVVCDDPRQIAELQARRASLPALAAVVGLGDASADLTLAELCARGGSAHADELDERARAVGPRDPSHVIYTSGTTGPPKGCVLSHGNVTAAVAMRVAADPVVPDDRFFLFLPLAHAYGLAVQLMALSQGAATIHATGTMDALVDQLAETAPTHLLCVPRFVEKLHARVTRGWDPERLAEAVRTAEDAAAAQARGAVPTAQASDSTPAAQATGSVPAELAQRLAAFDAELFAGVRAATGGRIRRAVVGSAGIATDLLRFFRAAGVLIVQGYGMTETAGFAATSTPAAYRFGTVGRPLPGVEVRIDDDGEILLRGPNIFAGYVADGRLPVGDDAGDGDPGGPGDDDGDGGSEDGGNGGGGDGGNGGGGDGGNGGSGARERGWLRTGDLGELDADGFLAITGRSKDLIITAGGKNVAPANIEGELRRSRWIEQAVVCGEGRPYLVALLALDEDELAAWAARQAPAAAQPGSPARQAPAAEQPAPPARLHDDPRLRALLQAELDAVNARFARPEQIKRYAVLERRLSPSFGELTPSMKIRRDVVTRNFGDAIERLYAA